MSDKKRELSQWELDECARLKSALESFNSGKSRRDSLTQGKIAEALDMSQGSVSSYLNGYNALNARFASYVAGMIGVPIDTISPRLAEEISSLAQAIVPGGPTVQHRESLVVAEDIDGLLDLATPRSRSVLERIASAARAGRLSDDDLALLDQIAARLEGSEKASHEPREGSHQRLRDKLQKNGPHTRK